MIKPEQVPEGLALIARKAWAEGIGPTNDDDWNAAIAAAISAWPGIKLENLCGWVMDGPDLPYVEETASIILPLTPQEASDDQ